MLMSAPPGVVTLLRETLRHCGRRCTNWSSVSWTRQSDPLGRRGARRLGSSEQEDPERSRCADEPYLRRSWWSGSAALSGGCPLVRAKRRRKCLPQDSRTTISRTPTGSTLPPGTRIGRSLRRSSSWSAESGRRSAQPRSRAFRGVRAHRTRGTSRTDAGTADPSRPRERARPLSALRSFRLLSVESDLPVPNARGRRRSGRELAAGEMPGSVWSEGS